jgi:Na+-driven multidrug efflux pump
MKSIKKIDRPKLGARTDLTEGSILKTLMRLAVPVTVSMMMFTAYLMVDLSFCGTSGSGCCGGGLCFTSHNPR